MLLAVLILENNFVVSDASNFMLSLSSFNVVVLLYYLCFESYYKVFTSNCFICHFSFALLESISELVHIETMTNLCIDASPGQLDESDTSKRIVQLEKTPRQTETVEMHTMTKNLTTMKK